MTIVLDSGVWVSALQFGGTPGAALDHVFSNHTIAICAQIETEVRATLVRKFSWKDEEVLSLLADYTIQAIRAEVTGSIRNACRDPKDDMVLECAVNADADITLTGDGDLLIIQSYCGISILSARQYIDRFAG